jgi:hypothetical protein
MSEKTILEQALLQINTLEEAVKQNAKGILASTLKEELNDLLKESMEKEEESPMDEQPEENTPAEEDEKDMSDEEAPEEEGADDEADDEEDLDNTEPTKSIDGMDSEEDADDEEASDEFGSEDSDEEGDEDHEFGADMDSDVEDHSDDVMDMTGASDEEVIRVFKKMKPEDGIIVKKDGDTVEFKDGENDYVIKLDESELSDEETLYEIELDEEEDEKSEEVDEHKKGADHDNMVPVKKQPVQSNEDKHPGVKGHGPKKVNFQPATKGFDEKKAHVNPLKGTHKPKKVAFDEEEKMQADEAARTKSNPHGNKGGAHRSGLPSKKTYKAGSGEHSINEEVETLKKQNSEYKKALVLFKEKLNEVAVFNANLAYATRLFTENSTTKQEKLNILKRFDSVSSLQESKNLFNTIQSELSTKTTTVAESVAEKISNTPQSSSSQEVLAESKAYENPQFARMRDLMKKVK